MPATSSTPPASISAWRTPAGLPGANAPSAADALDAINDNAKTAAPIERISLSPIEAVILYRRGLKKNLGGGFWVEKKGFLGFLGGRWGVPGQAPARFG